MNYFKKAYDIRIILLIKGIYANILQGDISYNMKRKKLYKKVRDVFLFIFFNSLFVAKTVDDTRNKECQDKIISINSRVTNKNKAYYLVLSDCNEVETKRYINLKEYNQLLDRQAQNDSILFLHFYSK